MSFSKTIPSMFHRRLVLLLAVVCVPAVVMAAQLARLTLAEGPRLRERAEDKLVRLSWTPTVRGRILDRKGRVLARDEPSYAAAVDYRVLAGVWSEQQAGRYARARHHAEWSELDAGERYKPVFDAHVAQMWDRLAEVTGLERGELERRRDAVIERVESLRESVASRRLERMRAEKVQRGVELTTEVEEQLSRRAERTIREQVEPHVIVGHVDDEVGFALLRLAERDEVLGSLAADGVDPDLYTVPLLPGLVVQDSGERVYPYERVAVEVDQQTLPGPIRAEGSRSVLVEGVATQLLGWMGSSFQSEDVGARTEAVRTDPALASRVLTESGTDRGAYRPGDPAGRSGVEAALENTLRGLRGLRRVRLDTGQTEQLAPEPGKDVRLSIDVMLQARIQAAMTPELGLARVQEWHGEPTETMPLGTPINGAAVVLEIETGDVLAAVSMPSFTRDELSSPGLFTDPVNAAWANRAFAVPYQPGSIVKPMVLAFAVTRGVYTLGERIDCHGHFLENRDDILRCWTYREKYGFSTHNQRLGHAPDAVEAIMASCNIFFYTLAQRLGVDGMCAVFRACGVDTPFNLGVGAEHDGFIGPMGDASKLTATDALFMGIGQGPVAWTPLHAAETYATLARGGVRLTPHVLMDRPVEATDLGLDHDAIAAALKGLHRAVNEYEGTGNHIRTGGGLEPIFTIDGVDVWGKTGTAQAAPVTTEVELPDGGTERVVLRAGDHSWFVLLVGPKGQGPKYAIAIVMEHAGSGGKVSGPIANQILYALRGEGYL